MPSVLITALLLTATLFIIGSFLFSAWRVHYRHKRLLAEQSKDLEQITGTMLRAVQLQDGSVIGVERTTPREVTKKLPVVVPPAHLSQHWYNQQRMVVSL